MDIPQGFGKREGKELRRHISKTQPKKRAERDVLPDVMQISGHAGKGNFDTISPYIETFVMQRLMDIA